MSIGAISAIGRVTFSEILRDKVLYNTLVISFLLLSVGVVVSRVSFIRPDRVVLDFGLTALAVSNGILAIFGGASLLPREFQNRTIFIALSKPIGRFQFLLGKFLGLSMVLLLNSLLLSGGYLATLSVFAVESGSFSSTLYWALEFLALQSLLLAGIAVFFSSFSTFSLSVMMTIGLYLIGVNLSQVQVAALKSEMAFTRVLLQGVSQVLPNFEHFNLGLKVTYSVPITNTVIFFSQLYAMTWLFFLLLASGFFLKKREG